MRLDVFLTENGLVKSRSVATRCIKEGLVSVNGRTDVRPSLDVNGSENIELLGRSHEFVGRGGMKLDYALKYFGIDVTGMRAVDIGASTGGFTDCLLKRGAKFVVAVDSGHGQLDPILESDSRVRSIEGFNARGLDRDTVGFIADIAVCDVSFISQTLILPAAADVIRDGGIYVGLVKPQFECGRSALCKGGIVRNVIHHAEAIQKVSLCAIGLGLSVMDIASSPITGGDGNREFLIYATKGGDGLSLNNINTISERICK